MIVLIDDDEKVASKKHTQFKTRVHKPDPANDAKGKNQLTLFVTKVADKPYP